MRLLILDFDGVISQSAEECFLVALNAYQKAVPGHGLPVEGPLGAGELAAFIAAQPELHGRFLELIPKGTGAADFFSAFLERQEAQGETQGVPPAAPRPGAEPLPPGPCVDAARLEREFYRQREELRLRDFDAWVGLHRVFPGVPAALGELARRMELALATAKDRRSVVILLERFGLAPYFPPARILAKEAAPSKREQVGRILADTGVAPGEALFIDDKVSQLRLVSHLGVACALALWGYNGEDERREAEGRGFRLLQIDELGSLGTGPSPGRAR